MRQAREPQGTGHENWHGTDGGYTNHRCGCEHCKRAHATAQRVYDRERRAAARRLAALPDQGETGGPHAYERTIGAPEDGA
jgi:hypothetical protein